MQAQTGSVGSAAGIDACAIWVRSDYFLKRSQFELLGDLARVRKQPNFVGLRRFRTQHQEELLQCPTPDVVAKIA